MGSDQAVKLGEIATGGCLSAIRTEGALADCDVFHGRKQLVAVGEAGVQWLEVAGR